jgi:Zinc carboxypeptidase
MRGSLEAIALATVALAFTAVDHRHVAAAHVSDRAQVFRGAWPVAPLKVRPTPAARDPIPAPESVFGFAPGADYKLATYEQVIEYLRTLAKASKNITLYEVGATAQRRRMYFALISSPANLARIEHHRDIWQRLAHPDGLTDADAQRLAREGKVLVDIDGGMHSTEVAGGQHVPLLAYDLVRRAAEPRIRDILDNVVLMLWPTMNPDGEQMVAEWYMRNVGTPYELSPLPRLYQEYVGHDNNRDAYMLNTIESRVVEHAWRQWEPQIIYVHHQTGPFPARIWIPPFSEPVGADAPPLVAREVNQIGMSIATALDEHGQAGATHMGSAFDAWYPGYVDYTPIFKNVAAFWTETALFHYATPHEYTIDDLPPAFRDLRPRSLYSSPWRPGWWRLRDAVEYDETASFAVLEFASKYKDSVLLDRVRSGRDQIARGRREPPYAYVVRQQQRDPVAAVELLRRLAFGGVRIFQLTGAADLANATYPAGTWVIPTDQEFAALAREVLDVQHYPDVRESSSAPREQPYDAAGWTLPLQMGIQVDAISSPLPAAFRAKLAALGSRPRGGGSPTSYGLQKEDAAPFDSVSGLGFDADPAAAAIVPPAGAITGSGPALAVDPAQNNAFRALNQAWTEGAAVQFGNGRYLIQGLAPARQDVLARSLALRMERTTAEGAPVRKPRLATFQPWDPSIDEGWTRWVLEQYGFEVTPVHVGELTASLKNIDTLILADEVRLSIEGMRSARRQSAPVRPEYAETLGTADVQALEAFVRRGGTVVCLNRASVGAIQLFHLPVRDVVAGVPSDAFSLPGSVVEIATNQDSRVMAGMPRKAAVFADGSPVFEPLEGFKGDVLASYADEDSPLLSGFLVGEQYLHGHAAALDVELDAGHVLLIGFRPQWRGQSFGTFRVLFNAVLR